MVRKYVKWARVLPLATMLVTFVYRGKAGEGMVGLDEARGEGVAPPEPVATEVAVPEQPYYQPWKLDILMMLDGTLHAAEHTLGWDNVFCSVALDKSVRLFEELRLAGNLDESDRHFIEFAVAELSAVKGSLDEKVRVGEGLEPFGVEGKNKKKLIEDVRNGVREMIAGPPSGQERTSGWERGDKPKEERAERGR